jgi:RNA polymerase sigma factor (TIGR02999 family)
MTAAPGANVTELLLAWQDGREDALERILPIVHQELRRAARRQMAGERRGHVLQPTALVNEVFLRLVDWKNVRWQSRAHFFAVAVQAMRRILVDWARNQGREKRGGGALRVSLSEAANLPVQRRRDLVALDDALKMLNSFDARKRQVVELRFFGGLELEEIADVLHVSVATVRRDWSLARAWLHRELVDPSRLPAAATGPQ